MDTPKTTTTKLLRRINRELDSFTHAGRQRPYAAWLMGELKTLEAKLMTLAGTQESLRDHGAWIAGGAGVSARDGAGNSDCFPPSTKNLQLQSLGDKAEAQGWGNQSLPQPPESDPDKKEIPQLTGNWDFGGKAIATAPIMEPTPKEAPRWPSEAVLRILGPVPNPSMFAAVLAEDGRRVSLLKATSKVEYKKNQEVRARWSSRGTVGNPMYEVIWESHL